MDNNEELTLSPDDPRVIAAQNAENLLLTHYGLQASYHTIPLSPYGIKLRVMEIGNGKPVIIVPGNTGDSFPLIPLMAQIKKHRIIAINRPGGGLSEGFDHRKTDFHGLAINTIRTVMDALVIEHADFVSHSIGGHWSLWFALVNPSRVSSLTLLGVPGNLIKTSPPLALRLLSIRGINRLLYDIVLSDNPQGALKNLSMMGHKSALIEKLPVSFKDCYFQFQRLPHYKISSLSLMESINRLGGSRPEITLTAKQLKKVSQPVQFLWGSNDPFGSVQTGRKIAELIPNAIFHEIENTGHLPWLEKPDICGELINQFITKNR